MLSLTRRKIGQVWIHHTGHDETRSYGTKTREWQMDTVIHCDRIERADTDVSFQLTFKKARERTPDTRADFAITRIALVGDRWEAQGTDGGVRTKVSPLAEKFFEALRKVTKDHEGGQTFGRQPATLDEWKAECVKRGLIDPEEKPDSARTLFNKHKRELIAANWIASNDTRAWVLT